MAVPIWKDYFVNLGHNGQDLFMVYRIVLPDNSDVIYQGKAFLKPGQTDISIRINDICADYLENVLPVISQAEFTALGLPLSFRVDKSIDDGEHWSSVSTIQFLNDWSYDYDYDPTTMGMSFPINGHIDGRQPMVWTGLNVSTIQATITTNGGSTYNVYIPIAISNDFNNDFNYDFARSVRSAGSGTAVFLPSAWSDVKSITIQGKTFEVVTDCGQYALYYINAYGGWDTLLIEGNTLEADNLTRHTRETEYDNGYISNRGKFNYVNEIAKTYTMHTGWLSDDQASRMHHLLNSTDVYLYDFATEQMIPVVLTGSTTEYKTFKNQGNRMVNYTIQAEVAQSRTRR